MLLPWCLRTPLSRASFLVQHRALHLSSVHLGQNLKTYYEDLEVHPQSSSKEIKNAFYKLSKEFHPDRNVDNESALKKFQNISEAYDTLSNPDKRTKYDKGVLGRSSSVAEREAATHKFEGENFYASRSNRFNTQDSAPSKNLDAWVVDHRKQTFENSKYQKRLSQGKANKHGYKVNNMHDRRVSSNTVQNQQTDKSLGFLAVVVIFVIVVIRIIM
jgi:curved DNA-binding protein CbpA